ncbi:MAG: 50S ribosomal protein L15 [Planctomycetia bacterium]|nr:50S ribosomal protein L15 [Planctomycetia bacterium]
MNINHVHRGITKHKKTRRKGRGPGTGQGKTAGRGHKGQKAVSGSSFHPSFEGGQMPLARRIPKRGFHNKFAKSVFAVNLGQIDAVFAAGEDVTPDSLRQKRLLKGRFDVIKVLGDGELTKKLNVTAHRFSAQAREKIAKAGGQAVDIQKPAEAAAPTDN